MSGTASDRPASATLVRTLRMQTHRAWLAVMQTWKAARRSLSGGATLKNDAASSTSASACVLSLEHVRASFAGRYAILSELGSGGMGVVYLARKVDSGQEVALKLAAGGTRAQHDSFIHEATAAARVVHPNVVRVLEVDIHEGRPFMAMERIRGESLDQALKRGAAWAPAEIVSLLREVCRGLDCIHRAGLIHRDLKPGNLMLPRERQEGEARIEILDFGIAIMDDYDAYGGITGTGSLAGTLFYMPPEAFLGQPLTIAADIYALGVIAYELLSGQRPFDFRAGRVHVALQVVHDQPPDLPSSVPRPLRDVVMRALAKDPAARQSSSLAFADELDAALGESHEATRDHG